MQVVIIYSRKFQKTPKFKRLVRYIILRYLLMNKKCVRMSTISFASDDNHVLFLDVFHYHVLFLDVYTDNVRKRLFV